jgi:3D (Asp-Asp-Asp) domain-containing protein
MAVTGAALLATLALAGPGDYSPVESTSYCLRGTMADGSYTRTASAANNTLRLGTRIWVRPAVFGRHRWVVRDRIGWGTELDFWSPSCGQAIAYGRRIVRMAVGWPVATATWHTRRHRFTRPRLDPLVRSLP